MNEGRSQHEQLASEAEELAFPNLKPGNAWGESITKWRADALEAKLRKWEEKEYGQYKGPFDSSGLSYEEQVTLKLSGADVFWLAARTLAGTDESQAVAVAMDQLRRAQDDIDIRFSLDERIGVFSPNIGRTDRPPDWANLSGAYLPGANLSGAFLDGADLSGASLDLTNLSGAFLRGTDLSQASLMGTNLFGAFLGGANLSRADLSRARLNVETFLNTTTTTTLLADVVWNAAPLSEVDWETLPVLGDETRAHKRRDAEGKKKEGYIRRHEYELAVRSYRLLAVALRSQGLNEHADRYAYRAQLMQRVVQRRRHRYLRYSGSLLLSIVSGYGYKPARSLIAYVVIICAFASAYLLNAQVAVPRLTWDEALVLSISSFHGRGFFTSGISLGDTLTRLAAGEAIVGLIIEIIFIATFTQRFFAR